MRSNDGSGAPPNGHIGALEHESDSVLLHINVSDEDRGGVGGFVDSWKSVFAGMKITAVRAMGPTKTVQYPHEKYAVSPRWRGALALKGVLGRDEIPIIRDESPVYNAVIRDLYDRERLPPCVGNCPANVDARGQNYYLAEGMTAEAYELVRERNIMPGVLGRICHHPCESACRRNYYDEPMAIRPLHRFAYEEYADVREERVKVFEQTRDQQVAVIGSGPSGLAAAFDLMALGYRVVVYEKERAPGGALFSGVPSYRLPRDVLSTEINGLVDMGLDLRVGIEIGKDVPIDHLLGEFDAVLIAGGLQTSRIIPVPGHDADGVRGALDFLKDANWKGDAGVKGKRVLVIGGGNVAVDVARCALRTGATEVRLACLEGDDEMPCHPWEIEEAVDEGVIAMCSMGPHEVLTTDGVVSGMKMRECLSVFDEMGRFAPNYGEDYAEVECETVVFATGTAPVLHDLVAGSDLVLNERGILPVDGTLFTTVMPNVFACGEVVTGPGSAIGSIATGHEAATSIHRYLSGASLSENRTDRPVPVYENYQPARLDGVEESRKRVKMPMARPEDRRKDFRQVETGFTHLEAVNEAARCLRCQSEVCVGCTFCARTCPDYAIQVQRVDDPGQRAITRYDLDLSKCSFCGLCAEQCPTNALTHTGQYELSFFHRDLMVFDHDEMLRDCGGTRATGADAHTQADAEEAS